MRLRRELASPSEKSIHSGFGIRVFAKNRNRKLTGARRGQTPLRLPARGIAWLWPRARRLEAKNCFAFLHQLKTIARNCFQIRDVSFEQIHLTGLTREQSLLLIHLLLQVVDLGAALHEFFVWGNK